MGKIDAAIKSGEEALEKERALRSASDDAKAAARKEAVDAENRRMATAWKLPYTGGKIYCEKEIWTYMPGSFCFCFSVQFFILFPRRFALQWELQVGVEW